MKKLEKRAAAIGRAAQRRRIADIEEVVARMGIRAETRADAVVLSGRGLVKRWLNETSLRFVTGLTR